MVINGSNYKRGVWEVHLENNETVMFNNYCVDVSTTTADLEANAALFTTTTESNDNLDPVAGSTQTEQEIVSTTTTMDLGGNVTVKSATSKFKLNLYCLLFLLIITFSIKL